MTAEKVFDNIRNYVSKNYRVFCVKKNYFHYFKLLKMHGIERKKLSHAQKKEIDSVWKGIGKYDYNTHIMAYSVTGKFDPYIVPEMLFRTEIEFRLNDQGFKGAWADKNYFSFHFDKELFPEAMTYNINGVFYDEDYNIIKYEEAKESILLNDKYVVKPSLDSGFGSGVALFDKGDDIDKVLKDYKKNYVVQKVFKQHSMLSEFNSSSVNVIRFISLFINGKVIPVMGALRCGGEGSFNDNQITKDGLGMFVIGIDENGVLKDRAYHSCGRSITKCPNGTEFSGKKIPGFEKMKDIIVECHSKMSYFGFIGWDFVIDENGNPVIMEYNIKGPGVLYYQYANGPLFGESTQEVISWLKNGK